jgi:hypothetical protein
VSQDSGAYIQHWGPQEHDSEERASAILLMLIYVCTDLVVGRRIALPALARGGYSNDLVLGFCGFSSVVRLLCLQIDCSPYLVRVGNMTFGISSLTRTRF